LTERRVVADGLGVGRSDPLGQYPVGRDPDHLALGLDDGGDRVVALAGRMNNLDAVHVGLIGSRPGSASSKRARLMGGGGVACSREYL
jgi:hypothetical protein